MSDFTCAPSDRGALRTTALVNSLIGFEPRNGGNGYAETITVCSGQLRGSMPGPPKPRAMIGRTCASVSSERRTTSPMISSSPSTIVSPIVRAERSIRAMCASARKSPPSKTRIPSNTPSP